MDRYNDSGTLLQPALEVELPAILRALPHAHEAEPRSLSSGRQWRGKPAAIIGDNQVGVAAAHHATRTCVAPEMLDGIGDRFLATPVNRTASMDGGRAEQSPLDSISIRVEKPEATRGAVPQGQQPGPGAQGAGAQLPNGRARLLVTVADHLSGDIDKTPGLRRCVPDVDRNRFKLDCEPGQVLLQGIVEFAGDASAFLRARAFTLLGNGGGINSNLSPEEQDPGAGGGRAQAANAQRRRWPTAPQSTRTAGSKPRPRKAHPPGASSLPRPARPVARTGQSPSTAIPVISTRLPGVPSIGWIATSSDAAECIPSGSGCQ